MILSFIAGMLFGLYLLAIILMLFFTHLEPGIGLFQEIYEMQIERRKPLFWLMIFTWPLGLSVLLAWVLIEQKLKQRRSETTT